MHAVSAVSDILLDKGKKNEIVPRVMSITRTQVFFREHFKFAARRRVRARNRGGMFV